ncbi:hypothetical protein GIY56_04000 [Paracoccus sp. YIM 132242]|uniref:DUF2846 domain-containing protein n=1 Tax=Paracoccus lichenicola TaxID=2665644 RepID=A0A6L6HLS1_9RHOB|nr:hypothetical protein [Paracoccus lichenicola]MTD99448.1 hypothetical protein [Paracoccus lichenicola]
MHRLFALLLIVATALPAWGQDPPRAGLMWNRSGLPATLPLVVQTMPGRDYVVFLAPPQGGDPVMAGFIQGGTFFRLLVPPGTWAVRFAHGRDWQGEDELFGPATEWIGLDQPLTFEAGVARRQGHLIRLMESDGQVEVASQGPLDICQGLTVTTEIDRRDESDEDREALNLLPALGLQDLRDDFDTFPRSDFNRLPAPGLRRIETELDTRSRVCPLD